MLQWTISVDSRLERYSGYPITTSSTGMWVALKEGPVCRELGYQSTREWEEMYEELCFFLISFCGFVCVERK